MDDRELHSRLEKIQQGIDTLIAKIYKPEIEQEMKKEEQSEQTEEELNKIYEKFEEEQQQEEEQEEEFNPKNLVKRRT